MRKRRPARRTEKRALVRLEATEALLREAAEDQQARRASGSRRSLEQRVAAAREIVRRAALAVRMSEAAAEGLDQAPAAPDQADPEHRLGAADEKARLWALVDELDPQARAIVEAVYLHGRSMTALAEELGVSVATVSRRHSRILDRLGKRLKAEG
jgi:RNA polymerase sigma factor for flagellar operon FliA